MKSQERPARKRLLLLGAGHAHMEVLKRFAMRRPEDTEVVLVSPSTETIYSGMLPGYIAGQYKWEDIRLDSAAACVRAGAVFVRDEAVRVSVEEKTVTLLARPALSFDVLSLDIGSRTKIPEIGEGANGPFLLSTRPFTEFRKKLPIWDSTTGDLVIIGGGHAGFELACAFRRRYPEREISLLEGHTSLPPSLHRELSSRRIHIKRVGKVEKIERGERFRLITESGVESADLVTLTTGASALPLVRASGLPEADGYLLVGNNLQASSLPVFGAGDCIALANHPEVPKSGVYAVREAPVLTHNLLAALEGRSFQSYAPQTKSLRLLNLGDGRAVAIRGNFEKEGRWPWLLKDWIDRRFIKMHAPEVKPMLSPDCGGCGSKVSASALRRMLEKEKDEGKLLWGPETAEDIALWKTSGPTLGLTVDQFRNFGADPWLFARIAAVSAASDLYAKGISPEGALMSLTVPKMNAGLADDWLQQLFSSVRKLFAEEGILLAGGQTNEGEEWNLGFTFWGEASAIPLGKKSGMAGDSLILTKPIGTGILLAAAMAGAAVGRQLDLCLGSMAQSQRFASEVLRGFPVTACTDVTGFSLLGHLSEMLGEGLSAELFEVPLLPGAREWFDRGFQSRMHPLNEASFPAELPPEARILYDPQTSGGLLFSVAENQAESVLSALKEVGVSAWKIGKLVDSTSGTKIRVLT